MSFCDCGYGHRGLSLCCWGAGVDLGDLMGEDGSRALRDGFGTEGTALAEYDDDNGIGIRRARAFREIIRSGSTRKAAQNLGITQSAVSQQLKHFEETVGEKLFQRDRRGLIPTSRAIELYNRLDRHFATMSRIEQEITACFVNKDMLTLSAQHAICLSFVPELLATAYGPDAAPDFHVRAQTNDQVAQSVLTGESDLGLSRLPLDDRFFEWVSLAVCGTVCLLPPGHRLAGRTHLTLDDIEGERVIMLDRDFASRQSGVNGSFFEGRGTRVQVRTDAGGFTPAYVRKGIGITIINTFIAAQFIDFGLESVPFHPPGRYEYVIFWRRGSEVISATHPLVTGARRIAASYSHATATPQATL